MDRHPERTFLAYERTDRSNEKPERIVAINPDILGEVDANLGLREPGDGDLDLQAELIKIASKGVRELMAFCFPKGQSITRRGAIKLAVAKFVAVAHAINPDALRRRVAGAPRSLDPPLSLKELADQLGAKPRELRAMQRTFFKAWSFKVRVQPIKAKRIRP